MINVKEAKEIVATNSIQGAKIQLPLNQALGLFLAEDIYAPINVPSFDQSAMDGYAFRYVDVKEEITIADEIPAGDIREITVESNHAVRIFTGAKVPNGCDTVVMQELTGIKDNKLLIKDAGLKQGGNIRKEGHQIKKGDLALTKGTKITAAAIGFLAALGLTQITVYSLPRVTILGTGDELVKPGNALQKGQVYESNTIMLQAALKKVGIRAEIVYLPDNLELTVEAIKKALYTSDMLLLSGGISVGDYDFVKPALEQNGVQQFFYKVKQKPGKPLFFGGIENKLVFALPGNPAAALNCFYVYVLTALNIWLGNPDSTMEKTNGILNRDYRKKSGRAEFLKAYVSDGQVELLEGQGSDVLLSFTKANSIVFLDSNTDSVKKGDQVQVYLLPV